MAHPNTARDHACYEEWLRGSPCSGVKMCVSGNSTVEGSILLQHTQALLLY